MPTDDLTRHPVATNALDTRGTWFFRFRRCFPAAILLFSGFVALYIVQTTEFSITGKPTRDFMWIIGVTELAIYIWIRAFAKVRFQTQITALVFLYGLQLCLYMAVRVDGFMGDGRPILVWRWTPTAEQRWTNHRRYEAPDIAVAYADLTTTTTFDYPLISRSRPGRQHPSC